MILVEADVGWQIDTDAGVDCSLGMRAAAGAAPSCFGLPRPRTTPLAATANGDTVNCDWIEFCPHSAGTHTEGVGHITKERVALSAALPVPLQVALLISVTPIPIGTTSESYPGADSGDRVITSEALRRAAQPHLHAGRKNPNPLGFTALCVRTLPNAPAKRTRDYTGSNPPFFTCEAAAAVAAYWPGVGHLVCDLPSVDRERSSAGLHAHGRFWSGAAASAYTITELAWFPDAVADGQYVLDLQTADLDSDAVLSRPVLYPMRMSSE